MGNTFAVLCNIKRSFICIATLVRNVGAKYQKSAKARQKMNLFCGMVNICINFVLKNEGFMVLPVGRSPAGFGEGFW